MRQSFPAVNLGTSRPCLFDRTLRTRRHRLDRASGYGRWGARINTLYSPTFCADKRKIQEISWKAMQSVYNRAASHTPHTNTDGHEKFCKLRDSFAVSLTLSCTLHLRCVRDGWPCGNRNYKKCTRGDTMISLSRSVLVLWKTKTLEHITDTGDEPLPDYLRRNWRD